MGEPSEWARQRAAAVIDALESRPFDDLVDLVAEAIDDALRDEVDQHAKAYGLLLVERDKAVADAVAATQRAERADAVIAAARAWKFGRGADPSGALVLAIEAYDAATAPAEAAGAIQGGGAVSGEGDAAKSDTQTFSRANAGPLVNWLGKD